MSPALRSARHRGATDFLRARIERWPDPANPFGPHTRSHFYWQWGTEMARDFLEKVEAGRP